VSFETVTDQNTEQMLMRYIEKLEYSNVCETWGREWRRHRCRSLLI